MQVEGHAGVGLHVEVESVLLGLGLEAGEVDQLGLRLVEVRVRQRRCGALALQIKQKLVQLPQNGMVSNLHWNFLLT